MAIKYFDFEKAKKEEYNYASVLQCFYIMYTKEQLKSFLVKEMDNKLLTKRQINKFFKLRGNLSWLKWRKHHYRNELNKHNEYHAQSIGIRGQLSAVKLVLEEHVFKKKVSKTTVDKMFTILCLTEVLQAYRSKKIRKIIYLENRRYE